MWNGRLVIIVLAINALCTSRVYYRCRPALRIQEGLITGTVLKSKDGREIEAFTGIPYAEPPIGDLRFRSPVPKKVWNGTLAANGNGNQCLQYENDNRIVGNEDCLYLNVYRPKELQEGQLLPVMVYIHGGGFVHGNGSMNLCGPQYLLDKDIVLVTMNYRLGIFGFLSTGDAVAPGNFGLKDQLLVLHWVQKNIRAFSGDPAKVTLFGESAGAASVHLHAISDRSKGLFHRYIIQSGNALSPMGFREDPLYYSNPLSIAHQIGCPAQNTTSIIDCLRKANTEQILGFFTFNEFSSRKWGPTVEPKDASNAFLTENPRKLFFENQMKESKFMTGNVKDEGFPRSIDLYTNDAVYKETSNDPKRAIREIFKYCGIVENDVTVEAVKNFYLGKNVSTNRTVFAQGFQTFIGDIIFLYPQVLMMRHLLAVRQNPFYFYSFEYRGTMSRTSELYNNANIGVPHSDDLIYLFPLEPQQFGLPSNATRSDSDYDVVNTMVDLWTSFAATGVPESRYIDASNNWKSFDRNNTYLMIGHNSDTTCRLEHNFIQERVQFWDMITSADAN